MRYQTKINENIVNLISNWLHKIYKRQQTTNPFPVYSQIKYQSKTVKYNCYRSVFSSVLVALININCGQIALAREPHQSHGVQREDCTLITPQGPLGSDIMSESAFMIGPKVSPDTRKSRFRVRKCCPFLVGFVVVVGGGWLCRQKDHWKMSFLLKQKKLYKFPLLYSIVYVVTSWENPKGGDDDDGGVCSTYLGYTVGSPPSFLTCWIIESFLRRNSD